jgi:PAS domain S-box-containing protein
MRDDEGVSAKVEQFVLGVADSGEQLYRSVYDAAPLAFVLWDRQCRVTDWNKRAEMMFGWTREEVLGRNFFEFLVPDHARPRVEAVVATLMRGVLPGRSIYENLTKFGDVILCEWSNTIRYGEKGQIIGAMSLGLDITARKRAERNLRESEERLTLIADNLPVLIAYVDSKETYRFVNKEYRSWFGLQPEVVVGKTVREVLGDDGYEEVRVRISEVLSGQNVSFDGTLPLTRRGKLHFHARYIPHLARAGKVPGFFLLVEDVSERKKSEEALKQAHAALERRVEERTLELSSANLKLEQEIVERKRVEDELRNSEQKYRALINEASDAIVLTDMNGRLLDVNRRAVDLLGFAKEELLQKNFMDLHPEGERNAVVSAFQIALRQGSSSLSDTAIKRRDGATVPVDVTGSVIQIGDRKVVQGLFRDITERKKTEEVVRNIAEGVAASTGEAFFHSLAGQLVRMLDMDYAIVGEFSEDREDSVQTIAVWAGGGIAENFRYELANTPCENVVGKDLCCYPQGVQEQFPEDEMLKDMAVESYVGVPLFDTKERPLGLIAVLDTAPLDNPQFVESTLRVFAARASAELERKRAEEALRKSEADLRFLSSALLNAQEQERGCIARELHDGIGQSLGTLKMRVETLLQRARSGEGRVDPDELSSLVPLIQETMEEVRNTSMGLRPSTLDTLGITATIGWFCREFQTTYPSIRVEREIRVQESEVPVGLKTVLYRILQEAFNNIAKHSGADEAKILVTEAENEITLSIEDNGRGLDLLKADGAREGFGLTSMRERTELSGGSFRVDSEKGRGSRIRAAWPIR